MRWRTQSLICDEAPRLIAAAVEHAGSVASRPLDTLFEHVEHCPSCSVEVETQVSVKRLLARRPLDDLPEGFAFRLAARLDAEQSRPAPSIDWRKWTFRVLPAAVGLVLVAVAVAVQRLGTAASPPSDLSSEIVALGRVEALMMMTMTLTPGTLTDRELLGALLIGAAPSDTDPRHKDDVP